MYDEVKAFGAAMDAAQEALTAGCAAIEASMEHTLGLDEEACPACVARNPVYDAFRAAMGVAWSALGESSDPLVRWIAEHVRDYGREARTILEALPASMADLDQIAEDKGWCLTWGEFRLKAERAGVLPDQAMAEASER